MRQMKKKMIIAIIVTLLLTAGIAFAINHFIVKEKDERIAELETQVADTWCLGFAKDLKADSIITQDDLVAVEIKETTIASGSYQLKNKKDTKVTHRIFFTDSDGKKQDASYEMLKEELIGRVIKANVSKNTLLSDSLLYPKGEEPTKDERIQEFNFITLPSDLVANDYIDIRMRFPAGEDYSVLIGKKVEKIAGENTIFIKLNEEEIMTIGSAIIEAYMQDGVFLYANKYTDPATQLFNEAIVDYVAKYDYAVERLIEEKSELELRRRIAEIIMIDAEGNSLMDEAGNIKYIINSGDMLDLEGTLATETQELIIPTTKETIKEENQYGDMVEVEVVYIAEEMLEQIPELVKTKAEANMNEITVEDFTNPDIVGYAGIEEEYVEEIRLAQENNDVTTLNYYKVMRVVTRDAIIRTYPVRREVLEVIKKNPNLLETIIAEFDATALLNTRVDEYYELKAQYEAEFDPFLKEEIKQRMDEIVSTRTGNVENGISTQIQAQKAERVSYLEKLING